MNDKGVDNKMLKVEKELKQVDYSISLIRMVALSSIIICHFMQYYGMELARWFNVGVQIFFCISGLLYGNKRIEDPIKFILKNIKKILVPYYCFLLPVIIFYVLFADEYITIYSIGTALFCSGTIKGIEHLWFISYIIFCYLITPYLYLFTQKIKDLKCSYAIFIFLAILELGQLLSIAYNSYFAFDRLSCYLIGYFLGFIYSQYGFNTFKKIGYFLCLVGVAATGIRIYGKYVIHLNSIQFGFFVTLARVLFGITIFFILFILFKNIKEKKILNYSDKYSYYIYIVQQLYILSPFSLMNITSYKFLNWILTLTAIIISSIILKYISDKVNDLCGKIEVK